MSERSVALIAVENCAYSFDTLFSYYVPNELEGLVCPGIRVMVPFGNGNKLRQGFVFSVSMENYNSKDTLKYVYSVLDAVPMLSEEMLLLATWIRERCFCTYFTAAKSILPGGMCLKTENIYTCVADISPELYNKLSCDEKIIIEFLRKKRDFVKESLIFKNVGLNKQNHILKGLVKKGFLIESSDAFRRVKEISLQMIRLTSGYFDYSDVVLSDKQRSVVNVLRDIGAAGVKEITYFTGVSSSVVTTLIKKGICEAFEVQIDKNEPDDIAKNDYIKPVLSDEQKSVFDKLCNAYEKQEYDSGLLFGVTGSGKTSVYLELIDYVLSKEKNVIVLVPEISLTPQTFSIFSSRYGNDIAVLHSALSMRERFDEWKRISSGKVRVVIGTRSAVFAPLDNIGLIIIDEEQEHTYKSEMSPRYNAKDVARFRTRYHNGFLLYASATPSIETYAKAKNGQMLLCELKNRYGRSVLPTVSTVDMTDKANVSSFFALSNPLADEIEKNLKNSEQSILLVNRRGFNTFVVCSDCKKVVTCPRCSISMTYHSANNRLMCHYCGYNVSFMSECPSCGAENIRYSGFGTQRVEQEIKIRFPTARVVRMDADTTTAKDAHNKLFSAFASGKYDILIGTQMVAKGLDFPNVTLVGIASADKELYNNDFRSAERTFDLITQVIGRSGRGDRKGRAVIQSVTPDNHIIKVASEQNYEAFYKSEINLRRALTYPPFCDIFEIGFSGLSQELVKKCADFFFDCIIENNDTSTSPRKIVILGPMAPKVSKINDAYRQRIVIKCINSKEMRELVNTVLKTVLNEKAYSGVNVYVDVNPESLN